MTEFNEPNPTGPTLPSRRRFIGTALFGALAVNLGAAWAIPALTSDGVVASTAPSVFVDVSQKLCGRGHLEPGLALRLYRALVAHDPAFRERLEALGQFLAASGGAVDSLQAALDSSHQPFAALPRTIVTAWYTGIVGDGDSAVCVAYEEALMNVTVADQLKPPSYAYGNYGSWARQPEAT